MRQSAWILLSCLLAGATFWPWPGGRCDDVYPDLDLSAECEAAAAVPGAEMREIAARIRLASHPAGALLAQTVRAWSLSLRADAGATIVGATTTGTDVSEYLLADGYERTELTTGPGNEGVVSAVILSFGSDRRLPLSADLLILDLDLEAPEPESGCREYGVAFVDGLVGSGQPVRNTLTCGEGITRRDDGGERDNDTDGYEYLPAKVCAGPFFVRGNVNGDALVNVSDAMFLLDALFVEGGEAPACWQAADVNEDGAANLSDVIQILNHLFRGGPPPAPPYPGCGAGGGESPLSCETEPGCA